MELRVGRSGLGDDWLYKYIPGKGWSQIGRYLEVGSLLFDDAESLIENVGREQLVVSSL